MAPTTRPGYLRLGVNIDHVATIRNARGGRHPDPVRAAHLAVDAGADGITAHLREDRRHISDGDIARLMDELTRPLNFEMAATEEMLEIALRHKPNACCLVPENRQEVTTEGGLDVVGGGNALPRFIDPLKTAGIRVSLFVDSDLAQIDAAKRIGADIVELHAGAFADLYHEGERAEADASLERLREAAKLACSHGLEVHAGHGLTFETAVLVSQIEELVELNIGHFLIGEAIFGGLHSTVQRMRAVMDNARAKISGAVSA